MKFQTVVGAVARPGGYLPQTVAALTREGIHGVIDCDGPVPDAFFHPRWAVHTHDRVGNRAAYQRRLALGQGGHALIVEDDALISEGGGAFLDTIVFRPRTAAIVLIDFQEAAAEAPPAITDRIAVKARSKADWLLRTAQAVLFHSEIVDWLVSAPLHPTALAPLTAATHDCDIWAGWTIAEHPTRNILEFVHPSVFSHIGWESTIYTNQRYVTGRTGPKPAGRAPDTYTLTYPQIPHHAPLHANGLPYPTMNRPLGPRLP